MPAFTVGEFQRRRRPIDSLSPSASASPDNRRPIISSIPSSASSQPFSRPDARPLTKKKCTARLLNFQFTSHHCIRFRRFVGCYTPSALFMHCSLREHKAGHYRGRYWPRGIDLCFSIYSIDKNLSYRAAKIDPRATRLARKVEAKVTMILGSGH